MDSRPCGRPRRLATLLSIVVLAAALAEPAGAAAASRPHLDVRVFAPVPAPGYPASVIVGRDGRVYVGTYLGPQRTDTQPSKVFAFARNGRLKRSYTITGQNRSDSGYGLSGPSAVDSRGLLYTSDESPPRILTIDPKSGKQRTYATLADVPPCAPGQRGDCSATLDDLPAAPDFPTFGPDGSLYSADYQQGLVWKVPPGGGKGHVWLTDPRIDGQLFGPAGTAFLADRRTLLLSVASTGGGMPPGSDPTRGKLWRIPLLPDGRPGKLQHIWTSGPFEAPDGFVIARSGHIYITLAGASPALPLAHDAIEELSSNGLVIGRITADHSASAMMGARFDGPAGIAFDGKRLLVANDAYLTGDPHNWLVWDIWAGERGLPLLHPCIRQAQCKKKGRADNDDRG